MDNEIQTNTEIEILEATLEDASAIGQIQAAAWLDSYTNPEAGINKDDIQLKIDEWKKLGNKRIEDNLNNPNANTWVAKKGDEVIGFAGILKKEDENEQSSSANKIEALFVDPNYQGQGIGSKLLETALNYLGNNKKVTIEVVKYNEGAIRLYQKFGFIEDGEATEDIIILPNGKAIPKILMVRN